ncbi:glycoside hydrolase family 73 protein [Klebsiella michiganensis]|uniref:glycoside hydrolase family 73 protein n=1 Tax=Klebsiella michiganensis TaxID=1134687 RepID=UPI003F5025DF
METRYPIRNANGKDFDCQEEILTLLRQEKHGRWLSGTNDMWHGGIHISRNTAPWSVLTPDTGDGAVPLQCIASGELVAWRVCQDYVMGNLGDKPLQYSPSFLLVRSVHKPTKDSSTWLYFYTLYMHLAPLSCYPKWTVYQVTPKGNGLIMRQYSGCEVSGQKAPPEVSHKARLHSGEQVLIERQETFLLHNGQAEVFGLARRLKGGAPVGNKFWTSARPAFVEPVGEQYGYLPGWMSVALKAGQFDTVVCPKVMTAIRAGDAIGFLGKEEVPDEFSYVTADWFSHIEVLSNDGRMPLFLNNPAQLHTGRQFLLIPEGKQLYQREEKGSSYSFEPVDLTNRGDAADIIPAESATSATDSASVAYLQIRPGTWIRKDDVETVSQNDLTKLKFKAIGQEPAKNQLRSLEQQWVIDAFRWLSSQIWAGRDMESGQLQAYYTRMADELEKVNTPENIQNENRDSVSDMLRHPNQYVDFFLRRLVVKHESEWHDGSKNPKWNGVLATMSGDSLAYVKQWLDAHEWMSQVPEFSKDEAVWHFHPVEFLAVISTAFRTGRIIGKEFVNYVFEVAKENEAVSSVPAAITTAQAILETGYGKSVPTDINSGKYSYNIFGIKAHGSPDYVEDYTHEVVDGKRIKIIDKFASYNSYHDSITGRADFFKNNNRYHFLFKNMDPIEWAHGLQRAGYATDPNYANSLISVIKTQGLIE